MKSFRSTHYIGADLVMVFLFSGKVKAPFTMVSMVERPMTCMP